MTFDFVADNQFRELLQRDYKELKACQSVGAAKSVLVLAGSIVEALIIEYFLQFLPEGFSAARINRLSFEDLLNLAETQNLLTKRQKNLAWVIKDYRNLVHPGKEVRKAEKFSMEDAEISISLVGIVTNAIEDKYSATYGYKANEILNKLRMDWQYRSVFSKVAMKMNQTERIKLLDKLVLEDDYQKSFWDPFLPEGYIPQKDTVRIEASKEFVQVVKRLVPNETVMQHLRQMLHEIEAGEQVKAFVRFNLFHEELNYLHPDEIEIVVVYIFSLFKNLLLDVNVLAEEQTYATIGKYVGSEQTKSVLFDFVTFCIVSFGGVNFKFEMELFDQVYYALPQDVREYINQEIHTSLSPFDTLPPKIRDGIFKEFLSRGIVAE
ncbi:hypothetical protein MKQ68_19085 [Chitinophaga horti]|uniref:DUF4145 domain-containing protein n=1 Tax=Chitinophaga horti TaxID=2920382 RepID=A0ABY6IXS7_9BACT|nr:hypothetical protein [Chitinophaga horti]UYQ92195.1 hypothetical protein MKQ68_19085 [Chitinophaga horti]